MKKYVIMAVLAAILYSLSTPISKLFLDDLSPYAISGLLYLGAGMGMLLLQLIRKPFRKNKNTRSFEKINRKDYVYVVLMIILDVIAPISLLYGLNTCHPENVSLLNNFEIVATTFIACIFFKEKISLKLFIGLIFIIVASVLLSINSLEAFTFSKGSLFIILACICWSLENNCTKVLSKYNPYTIVILKGLCSGSIAIIIALLTNNLFGSIYICLLTLVLGFVAYGLSIFFYVCAQNKLGASKTSAYYSLAPFSGCLLSIIIFKHIPNYLFFVSLCLMIIGLIFVSMDNFSQEKLNKS